MEYAHTNCLLAPKHTNNNWNRGGVGTRSAQGPSLSDDITARDLLLAWKRWGDQASLRRRMKPQLYSQTTNKWQKKLNTLTFDDKSLDFRRHLKDSVISSGSIFQHLTCDGFIHWKRTNIQSGCRLFKITAVLFWGDCRHLSPSLTKGRCSFIIAKCTN